MEGICDYLGYVRPLWKTMNRMREGRIDSLRESLRQEIGQRRRAEEETSETRKRRRTNEV